MDTERSFLVSPAISAEDVRKRTKVSDKLISLFSNHIRIAASQTEIRFFIGENYPLPSGEVVVNEVLSVTVTPQQAKSTLDVLQKTLAIYEKTFGEIKPQTGFPIEPPIPAQENKGESN